MKRTPQPITEREFKKLISPISSAGQPWTHDRISAWYELFNMFDPVVLAQGIARLALAKRNAFVEPSDLVAILAEQLLGRIPDVGEAYKRLREARKVWYPADEGRCIQARKMLDPLTLEALKGVGGFSAAFEADNEQVFLAQFTKAYERVVKRSVEMRVLPNHLKPKELPSPAARAIESRPTPAITSSPRALASPAADQFAERLARKMAPPVERKPIRQTEEQANAVRADQERKLKLALARKAN